MNRFVISDTHFGHDNIIKFTDSNGIRIRPEFNSIEEMNETIIDRWNKTVTNRDFVYHGGDICFNSQQLHSIMPRLNGQKTLILGNHDKLRPDEYLKYFKDISSAIFIKSDPQLMICHYPVHIDTNLPLRKICVHGHIHEKQICIEDEFGEKIPDKRYVNVSVERINYTPISIDDILKRY